MQTVQFLNTLVSDHLFLTFAIIYFGLILEGEFILVATGVLAHLGAINIWAALVFILFGGLSKSVFGYALGTFLHFKWNRHKLFKFMEHRINDLLPNFQAKPFWSLFISKFMIGTNNLAIIFSGYAHIDFRKYLRAEIYSTLIWAPILLGLGYFFGYAALTVSGDIWKFILVVATLFAIFVMFDKLISRLYELVEEFHER